MTRKLTYTEFLNGFKSVSKNSIESVGRLYHFTGDEDFLKEEARRKLVSLLVPSELKSFNLDILYGAETSADEIINRVSTLPVNTKKRLVIVYDLQKLSPFSKDMLLTFLPKTPDSACLVLFTPKISKPTKFYKALDEISIRVDFEKLRENSISSWISNRIKERGKKIETKAIRTMQESVGTDLTEVASEIDKLLAYVGDKEIITTHEVEAVISSSRSHNVFQFIDSIGEKNCSKSLSILNKLFLSGEKPGSMIFWLTNHLERLILTKEFRSEQGRSLVSFLGLPPFLASKYQRQAPNFTIEALSKGLQILYQADVDLKSNIMPDKTLMELLVYNLCHL